MNKKIIMNKLAIISALLCTQLSAQNFVDSGIQLTGKDTVNAWSLNPNLVYKTGPSEWGDFDNDGDLDVFVSNNLYRNDGNKTFVEMATNIDGVGDAAWGDYDNDGDLDLLRSDRIFRNDSIHGFVNINAGLVSMDCGIVDWGDYDNDGDLDVVVGGGCTFNNGFAKIYRNDGSNTFVALNITLSNMYDTNVEWGDYDGDQDLDLLYGKKLLKNLGNDQFVSQGDLPGGERTAWVDYDGDQDLDISITGDGATKILENKNNSFTDIGISLSNNWDNMGSMVWGDYDNDGDQDVLITRDYSYNQGFEIYRNDAKGVFTKIQFEVPLNFGFAGWGDFDDDQDLDIIVHGVYSESGEIKKCDLLIYENLGTIGVEEVKDVSAFTVFPNPSNEYVYINSEELGEMYLYEANGKLVKQYELNSKQMKLTFPSLTSGMYFLKLRNEKGISVQQMIVK